MYIDVVPKIDKYNTSKPCQAILRIIASETVLNLRKYITVEPPEVGPLKAGW